MNDELNMSVRKFLKQVGVTSQQAIEAALRDAGAGAQTGPHKARMVLTIKELGLEHVVEGEIKGAAE
ncbi:DUF6494 family protein [Thalassovita aquimarina]|uniref:Uncharacterized protein n=1 Tax=Thalassovita aquimarina TaxID=2785917 RepID=A0ABS5HKI3_9RHOB|nr:DUF6494 family protein [Thalassovita aquimarina]MBR9649521.1 hypothetical protein [Thalassovita aquimarina]